MNVLWIGYYDPEYPRNAAILKGLRANGFIVHEVRVELSRPRRLINLVKAWREYRKSSPPPDIIIVPMIDLETAPFALALTQWYKVPLVYDAFECRYTANVIERNISLGSFKARALFYLERWVLNHARLILVDTREHAKLFQKVYQIAPEKFHVIYISLDDDLFRPSPEPPEDGFLVQFLGYFHPLTGSDTIIQAAALLKNHPEIRFEVIGLKDNPSSRKIRDLVAALGLENVTLRDSIPYADQPREIKRASVCLGVFGDTDQAARVIPNKGYQALAMAKPLLTRDCPALREVLEPGIHVETVDPAHPQSLADAVLRLKHDPDYRERIARQGYQKFKSELTPAILGKALVARLHQIKAKPRSFSEVKVRAKP